MPNDNVLDLRNSEFERILYLIGAGLNPDSAELDLYEQLYNMWQLSPNGVHITPIEEPWPDE